jgi:hypothetical protein
MNTENMARLFCLLLLMPGMGCGGNGGGTSGVGSSAIQMGAALAKDHCASCHDPGNQSYSGKATSVVAGGEVFPPNLTPDKDTGIGSWSDDDVRTAMRDGVDNSGRQLCTVMPRMNGWSHDDINATVMFLRSLPPVSNQVPDTVCQ